MNHTCRLCSYVWVCTVENCPCPEKITCANCAWNKGDKTKDTHLDWLEKSGYAN